MNEYPEYQKETLYRIIGPDIINGMKVWKIYNAKTRLQEGPECFSLDEAINRVRELLEGKKIFWLGNKKFERKKV